MFQPMTVHECIILTCIENCVLFFYCHIVSAVFCIGVFQPCLPKIIQYISKFLRLDLYTHQSLYTWKFIIMELVETTGEKCVHNVREAKCR